MKFITLRWAEYTKAWKSAHSRTKYGLIGTALWLSVAFVMGIYKSFFCLSLNEMGDFLSGVFSPVAFLWLVIGYFQQGEELALNTSALLKQSEELEKSVQAQEISAKAQEASAQAQKEANTIGEKRLNALIEHQEKQAEKDQKDLRMLPSITGWNCAHSDSVSYTISMSIHNNGNAATNVTFSSNHNAVTPRTHVSLWKHDATHKVGLHVTTKDPVSCVVKMNYLNAHNLPESIALVLSFENAHLVKHIIDPDAHLHF